jgi:hypothetical protein
LGKEKNGLLQYHSISKSIKSKLLDDEQFWNILNYEDRVVSILKSIYIYNSSSGAFNIILQSTPIVLLAMLFIKLVIMDCTRVEGGQSKLISNHSIIKNNPYC